MSDYGKPTTYDPPGAQPCPWCGTEWLEYLMIVDGDDPKRPRRHVFCPGCNVQGPEGLSDKSAIEQWNKRKKT